MLYILEKFILCNYVLIYVLILVGIFCVFYYVWCIYVWFWWMKYSFYFLIKYFGWWLVLLIIVIVLNILIYLFLYDNVVVWFCFCICILGWVIWYCCKDGIWYKYLDINVIGWINFIGCLNRLKGNFLKVIIINDFLLI